MFKALGDVIRHRYVLLHWLWTSAVDIHLHLGRMQTAVVLFSRAADFNIEFPGAPNSVRCIRCIR